MDIEISEVTIRLLDKLWAIENQCFEQEAFTKQQLAYLIADYSTIGLTALVNGEIVGFTLARVNIRRNVTFGHILTIDVAPTYRRKGIAQKLLQEIENMLRERGVNECRLEVRENNKAALNLYRKLGYT
jgi:ribosomal-protein-alanine N-acetyltransferase